MSVLTLAASRVRAAMDDLGGAIEGHYVRTSQLERERDYLLELGERLATEARILADAMEAPSLPALGEWDCHMDANYRGAKSL